MKVYIVLPNYTYEGYGAPEGCFADRGHAEQCAELQRGFYHSERDVIELEIETVPRSEAV